MKFTIPNEVRLTKLSSIINKNGNEMYFASITNTATYENLTTTLELAVGQSVSDIIVHQNYKAIVEFDGKYGSVMLMPLAPPQAAPAK